MRRSTPERNCCDGRCANGEHCPAIQAHATRREQLLAPRREGRATRLAERLRAAGRAVLRHLEGGW